MALRVLIAGGGLGGLTLAHALRTAGLEPLVFERGPAHVDLTASYRIHIDSNGSRALRVCLSPERWSDFEARSAAAPRGLAFATEHLRQMAFLPDQGSDDAGAEGSHPISRSGLRQLLLTGLADTVSFDKRVVGFDQSAERGVALHFADGSSARGDVLVGADGSSSPVRTQLLPAARVFDTGVAGIAGKVYLDDRLRQVFGERLLRQMTMVLPVHEFGMFVAPFVRRDEGPSSLDLPEHLFWVVVGRAAALGLGAHPRQASPADLQQVALRTARRWHPLLRQLIAEADVQSILGVPLHSSEPVAAWPPSRVTLLGDAIHTMTPLQGLGGNTALQDAAILARQLIQAARGETDVVTAIGTYEAAMRQYAFEAVRRSLQVSEAVASTSTLSRVAFRTVLGAVNVVPPLGNVVFKRPSSMLPAA